MLQQVMVPGVAVRLQKPLEMVELRVRVVFSHINRVRAMAEAHPAISLLLLRLLLEAVLTVEYFFKQMGLLNLKSTEVARGLYKVAQVVLDSP